MSKRRAGCLVASSLVLVGGVGLGLIISWFSGMWWIVALAVASQQ